MPCTISPLPQCTDHMACGGPSVWRSPHLFEDWTLTNLYGAQLVEALHKMFHAGTLHGTPIEGRKRLLRELDRWEAEGSRAKRVRK